jgi:hypothetical protein
MNRRDFLGACAALPLIPVVTQATTPAPVVLDMGVRHQFLPAWATKYRLRGTGSLLVTVVGFQRRSSTVLFDNHYQSYRTCEHPDFSPFQWKLVWELDPFGQWHPNISETGFEEENRVRHLGACVNSFLKNTEQAMRLAVNAAKTPGFA